MDPDTQLQDQADWARRNLAEQVRHLELLALQLRERLDSAERERDMFRVAAEERLAALLETERQRKAEMAASQIAAKDRQALEEERRRLADLASTREQEYERQQTQLRLAVSEKEWLLRHAAASERILQQQLVVLQNEGLIHLVIRKLRGSLAD